ncbi:MAG: hypothetical protein M3411_07790 [Chloroflexota bacterium]|nr:hypothetical protein [Chloroflexota bacterium]
MGAYFVASYTQQMSSSNRSPANDTERDLLDAMPPHDRSTTQFERSFGPSCLLSLIIVFLLVVVLKRFLHLSWVGLGLITVVIWIGVLLLLVRWRPDRVIDED